MSDPFLGEIHMFAGYYAPNGYAECLGQYLPVSQNEALYSLLETTYGGDGFKNFGIPDFRGRLPVHAGTGPGTTIPWRRGMIGGTERVTLTESQLPAHTHTVAVTTNEGDLSSPQGCTFAAVDPANKETLYIPADQSPPLAPMSAATLSKVGGGESHTNVMPFLAIRFAIALTGTYPPRP